MPPFLVALVVAGVAALAYKRKPAGQSQPQTVVLQANSPANLPVGITSGFTQAPIQASVTAPLPNHAQKNVPSASGSGVPGTTPNAVEFQQSGDYQPAPGAVRHPSYYNPVQQEAPIQGLMKRRPQKPASNGGSCSCGGGHSNTSDCAISQARNRDGACMAPTRRTLLESAPPGLIEHWASMVQESGVSTFQNAQQLTYDAQQNNSHGEDVTLPASPFLTGIGLHYPAGVREPITNY